jgi:hypothetical protein
VCGWGDCIYGYINGKEGTKLERKWNTVASIPREGYDGSPALQRYIFLTLNTKGVGIDKVIWEIALPF